jgi:type IV pilus assembly protein PilP
MALACALIALSVTGCVKRDKSDLERFVTQTLKRSSGSIPPLPRIKPYQSYLYQAADQNLRDPFRNFINVESKAEIAASPTEDASQRRYADEITAHNREELENFELDSLRMVGTLQDDDELWGVILDNAGTVHRVQIGNYLGRNYGKILNIQEDRIEVREVVKDSEGRWEERQANLALNEENNP